jgi:hypothetical protein
VGREINNRGKIRHPVYGDRSVWADTTAKVSDDLGWFDEAVTAASPETLAIMQERLDKLAERIAFGKATGTYI